MTVLCIGCDNMVKYFLCRCTGYGLSSYILQYEAEFVHGHQAAIGVTYTN